MAHSKTGLSLFFAAVIVSLTSVVGVLLSPATLNAATTYAFSSDGKLVVKHDNTSYTFGKQAVQTSNKDTYSGAIKIKQDSSTDCMLGVQILVESSKTSGAVSTPAYLNGLQSISSPDSEVKPVGSCSRDFASSQSNFNKSITISSTGTPTPAPANPESVGQREAIATVYSPVETPPAASVTMKQAGKADSKKDLSWSTANSVASARWSSIEAGTQLEFCLTPVAPFDTQQCKTGTKEFGKTLMINFGSFEGSFNPDGKKVNVEVNIHVAAAPGASTYGPVGLVLYNMPAAEGSTSGNTNSRTFGDDEQPTVEQDAVLAAVFDNIEPGQYKVCLRDNTELCSPVFQKEVNLSVSTSITLSPEASLAIKDGTGETSCGIEGVGWIVCPVLNFLSSITDAVYGLISSWLTIDVGLFQTNTPTHNGWKAMRDVANAGFAIIFLIVIFSQLTGTGISNYGVKKMLPRLVVMAIVINLSFYITQFMVDISNILGASIKDFFGSQAVFGNSTTGFLANGNTFTDVGTKLLAGTAVAGVAAAAAVGAVAYGGIGLFIMVILSAIIAVAATLLILAARQAFVVILIVLSPLAFLAMILPNTKKWYDTWQKIFVSLLVIYPLIALVFGASEMAANILVQQNAILGLAVATIPLFAVIPMVKGSLKAVPIAGNLASKFARGTSLTGSVKNGTKQARNNAMNSIRSKALSGDGGGRVRRASRWLAGGQARGAARDRRFGTEGAKAEALYTSNRAINDETASNSERAAAVAALHKIEEEEIANIVTLDSMGGGKTPEELLNRLRSSSASTAEKIAAVRQIEARGGMSNKLKMAQLTSSPALAGDQNATIRQSIVASTAKMGESNLSYGGGSLIAMQNGTFDATQAHVAHAGDKNFSARSLLGMHPAAREEFLSAIQTAGDAKAKEALRNVQTQIANNPDLAARADADLQNRIRNAINGAPSDPAAPPASLNTPPAPAPPDESRLDLRGPTPPTPPNPPNQA